MRTKRYGEQQLGEAVGSAGWHQHPTLRWGQGHLAPFKHVGIGKPGGYRDGAALSHAHLHEGDVAKRTPGGIARAAPGELRQSVPVQLHAADRPVHEVIAVQHMPASGKHHTDVRLREWLEVQLVYSS